MDIIVQRLTTFTKKLRDDLRQITGRLSVLHDDLQKQTEAISTRNEGREQDRQIQPPWLENVISKYQKTVGEKKASDDRQHSVQNSVRWATWLAFFAASFYAALAACQWKEMKQATKAANISANTALRALQIDQHPWMVLSKTCLMRQNESECNLDHPELFVQPKLSPAAAGAEVAIANVGKSPAFDVQMRLACTIVPAGQRFTRAEIADELAKKSAFRPGTVYPNVSYTIKDSCSVSSADIAANRKIVFIYGSIEYQDPLQTKRWSHFCGFLSPTFGGTPCGCYNDTDDTKPAEEAAKVCK